MGQLSPCTTTTEPSAATTEVQTLCAPQQEKPLEREACAAHPERSPCLPQPWDFPGKSTGVGCHCLLQFWKALRHYLSKLTR